MLYYNDLEKLELGTPSVVTLGKFDGMHRGHQKLIKKAKEIAVKTGGRTVMFTFDVPPQTAFGQDVNGRIVTSLEKRLLAERFGIDVFVECPFTERLRGMSAEEFMDGILKRRLCASAIVAGEDFRFGKDRGGDAAFLLDNSARFGIEAHIVEKEKDGGRDISSTYIREEIEKGDIKNADRLLGYDYFILGQIVHGKRLGRNLGFPTINITPPTDKLLPPNGVYASATHIDGKSYKSISNIGVKPTVGGGRLGVETFILDFSGDLYGKEVEISLSDFIRPEMRFDSIEQLKERVIYDIEKRRETP